MTRGLEQLVLIHLKYFESYRTKISGAIVLAKFSDFKQILTFIAH